MKRKKEQFPLRVIKGGFAPADSLTAERLREKGYRVGDVLMAELRAIRNPRFYRLAHAFGKMCAENIEDFTGMTAHNVLKRLQWESGIGCEEIGVKVPGVGYTLVRMPQSLSFASMDEGEFREVYGGLCAHVAQEYWLEMSAEKVEQMSDMMPEAI